MKSFTNIYIALAYISACIIGAFSILAALTIVFAAVVSVVYLARSDKISTPVFFIGIFLLCVMLSGFALGGFKSAHETSLFSWISDEGRIFLYFWPGVLMLVSVNAKRFDNDDFYRVFYIVAPVCSVLVIIDALGVMDFFSTHHAAGAVMATVFIVSTLILVERGGFYGILLLSVSLVGLLASNSRTSLLAALLCLAVVLWVTGAMRWIVRGAVLAVPLAASFMVIFPYQSGRLVDGLSANSMPIILRNYQIGFDGESSYEVWKAWDLNERIMISGDANLAIRGYLWGRASREALDSPFVGIGFGRFNDIGRKFSGAPGFVYVVEDSYIASPTDQTAHNTYLHHLAELGGFGFVLIIVLFVTLFQKIVKTTSKNSIIWKRIGLSMILYIAVTGVTQHSIGAPIYGLTAFMMLSLSYTRCADE